MAVANPGSPNLSPSYENIIQGVNKQADIALRSPGKYDALNAIANPIVQEVQRREQIKQQRELAEFKAGLDDKYKKMEQDREFLNSGGIEVTDEHVQELEKELGVPSMTIPRTVVGKRFKDEAHLEKYIMAGPMRVERNQKMDVLSEEFKKAGKYTDASLIQLLKYYPEDDVVKIIDTLYAKIGAQPKPEKTYKVTNPHTKEVEIKNSAGEVLSSTGPTMETPRGELKTNSKQFNAKELEDLSKEKQSVQKLTQPIIKRLDALQKVEELVRENNPGTLINIKAEDLQTSGLTGGRLNQKYIETEGFSPGIAAKIVQAGTRLAGNQALSEENKKNLLQYVELKKRLEQESLDKTIEDASSNTALSDVSPTYVKVELGKHAGRYYVPSFSSVEEAESAKLPKGTRIKIDGKMATVQ